MKHWPVLVLIAAAVLLLASPGLIGRLAEKNLEEGLKRADLDSENIAISAESFRRGWFSSEGRHRIELRGGMLLELIERYFGGDAFEGDPALIVETRLDHGPIPISSMQRDRGSLSPGLANSVSTILLDPGNGETVNLPASIYGFIGLGGAITYRALVNEGRFAYIDTGSGIETEVLSTWKGADITLSVSADGLERTIDGVIEPASFSIGNGEVEETIGRIRIGLRQNRREHPLGETDLSVEVELLSMRETHSPEVSVGPLRWAFRNEIEDGRTSGSGEFSMTMLGLPELGDAATAARFSFNGLDADAMAVAIRAVKILNGLGDDAVLNDPAIASEALEDAIESLAANGGRLRIEEAFLTLPAGEVRLNALDLDVKPTDRAQDDFSWPSILLNTEARLEATLSEGLVDYMLQQNPEFRSAIAGGFLLKTGNGYEINAELDGGRLMLNGAPMNLPVGLPR